MTKAEFYSLDSGGLVIARGAVSSSQVDELLGLINSDPGRRETSKFGIMNLGRQFMELMEHPWVLRSCAQLLGREFRFDHAFGINHPPAGENLHGGPLTCQSSCFYLDTPRGSPFVGRVSVGIALAAQDQDTGGFTYLPGSHRSSFFLGGRQVLRDILLGDFSNEALKIPKIEAGDIYLFPDCLVHGTSPSKSGKKRQTLYYMYSPGFMAWRPYEQIEGLLSKATSNIQRKLLRPPYVAAFEEVELGLGDNQWRDVTI